METEEILEESSTLEDKSEPENEVEIAPAEKEGLQVVGKKKFAKNIGVVLFSNIISVLAGILVGFIIPKIMGVSEHGYYKTFTLYSSYIGLLHFGFIDGIYLKFAGKKYEDLDKERFKAYTKFLLSLETIVTLLIVVSSVFFLSTEYFLVVLFVGLNVLATNVTTYFEFISQITMRFTRITIRNVIRCGLTITSVIILYILYKFNSVTIYNYMYVAIVVSIHYALAIWYMITYRDITFGKSSIRAVKNDIFNFFKVGIPLLLANLVAQFVFLADQQVVQTLFDNDTFSTYAFAYTMINLITVATSAISVVLYPTLRTMNNDTIKNNYSKINAYLLMFVAFCLIAYYPLLFIVEHFLSQYYDSMETFRIILPGVLISSSISVIKYNCYKTFNKINNYFFKSLFILALSIAANLTVYFIYHNTMSISMVSIAVLIVWYLLVELYFIRTYHVKWISNFLYMILVIAGFYGSLFIPGLLLSGVSYLAYYIVLTIVFNYSILKNLFGKVRSWLKKRNA